MTTKFLKTFVAVVPLLCFASTVSAKDADIPRIQKPDPRAAAKAALIEHYDCNKDGKLNAEEIESIGRDRMLKNDRNNDGRVDQVELKNPKVMTRKMPKMDALQRAIAREQALSAARTQEAKQQSKAAEKPVEGQGN
jgi:hypothetical protein